MMPDTQLQYSARTRARPKASHAPDKGFFHWRSLHITRRAMPVSRAASGPAPRHSFWSHLPLVQAFSRNELLILFRASLRLGQHARGASQKTAARPERWRPHPKRLECPITLGAIETKGRGSAWRNTGILPVPAPSARPCNRARRKKLPFGLPGVVVEWIAPGCSMH
jgi:hypothetical protein